MRNFIYRCQHEKGKIPQHSNNVNKAAKRVKNRTQQCDANSDVKRGNIGKEN